MLRARSRAMSSSQQPVAFTHRAHLPFDHRASLFSWIFRREEFQKWLLPGCKWQLRLMGGPGSGKTTLSVLAQHHLHDVFQSPNVGIVTIFFTSASALNADELVQYLLMDISRQLSPTSNISSSLQFHLDEDERSKGTTGIAAARAAIAVNLSHLDRVFLLLDDVDLCTQLQWQAIEAELSILQRQGVNVMTTSRLTLWHEYSTAYCDTGMEPEHGHLPTQLFWFCMCQDSVEEAFLICQSCKDAGYVCVVCGETDNLVEPYDHVDLSVECTDEIMSEYVSLALEQVHGNLGLTNFKHPTPPHSKLGRLLFNSLTVATQLRDKIVQDAEGNIGMAKLRLSVVDGAKTVEEVVRYGDRLPAVIVALLDKGISIIQKQLPDIADLGLKAIVGVANEFHERPFSELERWLRVQVQVKEEKPFDRTSRIRVRRFTVEEVLRAAAGYLVVDNSSDHPIRLYHDSFGFYVTERYNETLFWIHTSTNAVGTDDFEQPQRMQTWHASRRNLSRADTWK